MHCGCAESERDRRLHPPHTVEEGKVKNQVVLRLRPLPTSSEHHITAELSVGGGSAS